MQPLVSDWQKTYRFRLVIISPDRKDDLQKFIDKNNVTATVLHDRQGEVIKQYGVQGIPAAFLVGRDGQLEENFVGWGSQGISRMESWLEK